MSESEAWVMIPKLDKDKTGCILDMRPLVLCKDCKHYDKDPYCKGFGDCAGACDNLVKVHDDWFCADGERN